MENLTTENPTMGNPTMPLEISGKATSVAPVPKPSSAPHEYPITDATFRFKDFNFFKPRPDPTTGHFTGGSLIEVMLLALCASEDPNIKALLTAAQIEMRDVQNQLFFPRP